MNMHLAHIALKLIDWPVVARRLHMPVPDAEMSS